MNEDSSRDFLIALSLLPFLSPNRTRLLRDLFDPIEGVCGAPSRMLEELLRLTPAQAEQVKNPLTHSIRRQVVSLRDDVLTIADLTYPALLKEIADPPLVLHIRGDPETLGRPAIAIVGSRRASPYAVNVARHFSQHLAATGLAIASGLARGVDAAAHEACLEAGGLTIAVLGTGIDLVYPRNHDRLARRIALQGVLISEFPPGTPPLAENFPMRNRVISGLAAGVIVVEATSRSGSLITARMAAEQGRDVFAVPGSIFAPGSEGAHRLIQSGAKLVHDLADVLEEIQPGLIHVVPAVPDPPEGVPGQIFSHLSHDAAISVDDLATILENQPASFAQSLLELELGGWIRALPGGRYVRAR